MSNFWFFLAAALRATQVPAHASGAQEVLEVSGLVGSLPAVLGQISLPPELLPSSDDPIEPPALLQPSLKLISSLPAQPASDAARDAALSDSPAAADTSKTTQ